MVFELHWFETRCAVCREPGRVVCRRCAFAIGSSPTPSRSSTSGACDVEVRVALSFDGAVRTAVLALKYRHRRAIAGLLATVTAQRLRLGEGPRPDVVTWAPTSAARRRRRGYDQAELIARGVARELGVPCRRLLYRSHGAPQTGRSRGQRIERHGDLGFRSRRPQRALSVLLVDDVVTTGTTLADAAGALRDAGVAEVRCVAVAATPVRGARPPSSDRADRADQAGSPLPARPASPARRRTSSTAAVGSSSTRIAAIPSPAAGGRLVSTSSRNAARRGSTPSRAAVSS